jgi:hypothetical protein
MSDIRIVRIGWQESTSVAYHRRENFGVQCAILMDCCLTMLYGPAWTEQEVRYIPRDLHPNMSQVNVQRIMSEYDAEKYPINAAQASKAED